MSWYRRILCKSGIKKCHWHGSRIITMQARPNNRWYCKVGMG